MPETILLIDDEEDVSDLVRYHLKKAKYRVVEAVDGEEGIRAAFSERPDAIVLDVMMPRLNGFEVAKILKADPVTTGIPILFLSAKGEAESRIKGLELGADDYLAKPFEPRELLARIRALLRRHSEGKNTPSEHMMSFGALEIDRGARQIHLSGALCDLTSYQFDLLVALAERAGRVLSRDQIMEAVRGRELEAFDRSIDVHIGRIRQAIEFDVKNPKRILTVRGVGYVFAKQQD